MSVPPPPFSIVLPALNEHAGLKALLPRLRALHPAAEIVVVDDGSPEPLAPVATAHGARCITHPYTMGNGAAVKSGARAARGAVIVFMDADGQHQPEDVARLLARLEQGYDMVVGARRPDSHANRGRPIANALYNAFGGWMVNQRIDDLTSGFRAVRAGRFREFLHLLPNAFSYPTTSTMAFFRAGYAVAYEPIVALTREGKSHIRPMRDGVRFLIIILKVGTLFSPMKLFLPVSSALFATGLGYYAWTYWEAERFTNMSALLISVSVLTFLIGLVSDQVTTLMYMQAASRREGDGDRHG
jgi:glycosyltransferase involved in cell wall biosynthesis